MLGNCLLTDSNLEWCKKYIEKVIDNSKFIHDIDKHASDGGACWVSWTHGNCVLLTMLELIKLLDNAPSSSQPESLEEVIVPVTRTYGLVYYYYLNSQ